MQNCYNWNFVYEIDRKSEPPRFLSGFHQTYRTVRFTLCGRHNCDNRRLEKQVVDELHIGRYGLTKTLAEINCCRGPGCKKTKKKCNTFTACISSGKKLKYQLPMTKKINLSLLTEPENEIQSGFSGKLNYKHVSNKPDVLIGIDRYSKWPVV